MEVAVTVPCPSNMSNPWRSLQGIPTPEIDAKRVDTNRGTEDANSLQGMPGNVSSFFCWYIITHDNNYQLSINITIDNNS